MVIALGDGSASRQRPGLSSVSILAVLWVQVGQYPTNLGVSQWHMPVSRSAAKAHFPNYQGVTPASGQRAPIKTVAQV